MALSRDCSYGAKGAAEIIFKKDIVNAEDKQAVLDEKISESRINLQIRILQPKGIHRRRNRTKRHPQKIIYYFDLIQNKVDYNPRRKHGNIPFSKCK